MHGALFSWIQRSADIACHTVFSYLSKHTGQMITQPPRNATTALGTNATFTCRENGNIMLEISNTQISEQSQVVNFATVGVYAPLPTPTFSELFMTGTLENNVSRTIQCVVVDPNNPLATEESEVVQLLVYGE